MSDEDESLADPPPPTAERVAKRACVLAAVSCRGFVENDRDHPAQAQDLATRAYAWLGSLGLSGELSPWEKRVLETPVGKLAQRDQLNASWLSEAVAVLAWALDQAELPGYEMQCDPAGSANSLGFLQPPEDTVLALPSLRTLDELKEYNEFVYNLHWRLRDYSLNRRPYDFRALARKAWGDPILRYGLNLAGDDLAIAGVAISEAPDAARSSLVSITQERHRASNWLIGYASEDFYEVTTDT